MDQAAALSLGKSAEPHPSLMALSSLITNSLGGRIGGTNGARTAGECMAQSAQNMAMKSQLPFAIGLAVCNGEPYAVAKLAHPKTAFLLFGQGGINQAVKGDLGPTTAIQGAVQKLREGFGIADDGTPGALDLTKLDFDNLADAKNAGFLPYLFKAGPGVPLNGPAGPAMRSIIAQFGDGPQGAIRLGLKLQMEQARLGHDRTFGGLVPMLFGSSSGGTLRSVVDPYNLGGSNATSRNFRQVYRM
jgi:hypothetical protein